MSDLKADAGSAPGDDRIFIFEVEFNIVHNQGLPRQALVSSKKIGFFRSVSRAIARNFFSCQNDGNIL